MAPRTEVDDNESVTLHSSWRGIVLSAVGAGFVLLVGVGLLFGRGPGVMSVALTVVGVVSVAVVLFDYPVASRLTPGYVERRALLRRHRLDWDRVDQLTRTRPSLSGIRSLRPGGLVAKVGRRKYLLVDQCESLAELDRVQAVLGDRCEALGVDDLVLPHAETDPTWTYRRSRWQPDR